MTLSDIGAVSNPQEDTISSYVYHSLLIPIHHEHWESNPNNSVHTQAFNSISHALTRKSYNDRVNAFEKRFSTNYKPDLLVLTAEEAAFWGADEGLAIIYDNYESRGSTGIELLLRSNNSILQISIFTKSYTTLDDIREAVLRVWDGLE